MGPGEIFKVVNEFLGSLFNFMVAFMVIMFFLAVAAGGASADTYVHASGAVCEVDNNNTVLTDCSEFQITAGKRYSLSTDLELRYFNVRSDIENINGALFTTGFYERDSVGLFVRRRFDNGLYATAGAGISELRYEFTGPVANNDFIVRGGGTNHSGFWAVGGGVLYPVSESAAVRLDAMYLQHPDQVFISNVGRPGDGGFYGEPRTYSLSLGLEISFD